MIASAMKPCQRNTFRPCRTSAFVPQEYAVQIALTGPVWRSTSFDSTGTVGRYGFAGFKLKVACVILSRFLWTTNQDTLKIYAPTAGQPTANLTPLFARPAVRSLI